MSAQSKLTQAIKIIEKLTALINLFDEWVQKIKANELPEAAEIVKKSNILRTEITVLKKQFDKKSDIIFVNQKTVLGDKFN